MLNSKSRFAPKWSLFANTVTYCIQLSQAGDNCCVCVVNLKESEQYHSMGSMMDGSPLGPKTDRDHLEGNLGRYIQRNGKGKERIQWPWVPLPAAPPS